MISVMGKRCVADAGHRSVSRDSSLEQLSLRMTQKKQSRKKMEVDRLCGDSEPSPTESLCDSTSSPVKITGEVSEGSFVSLGMRLSKAPSSMILTRKLQC
jgi:hypothetical protein